MEGQLTHLGRVGIIFPIECAERPLIVPKPSTGTLASAGAWLFFLEEIQLTLKFFRLRLPTQKINPQF